LLRETLEQYTIVDVGAHGTSEADVYAQAVLPGRTRIIGFEADAVECARLNARGDAMHRYFPIVVGNGERGTFHRCRSPLTSSLLAPNAGLLERYENLSELCEVITSGPVGTTRLDDVGIDGGVDLLKLDIQGAELQALEGGRTLLGRTLVIHVETEFVPIYAGQPLFSECELFLRGIGFAFHHFTKCEGRRLMAGTRVVGRAPSALLWADAVFVPTFDRLDHMQARELGSLAWTMHTLYGACDFAMACLHRCPDGKRLTAAYAELLSADGMLE
jgi:FkbM family methyltransferase